MAETTNLPRDLVEMARGVIDANRYLTLGTTEPDLRPRVSPVYFTHLGYRTFYWVSSPQARHSGNVSARPDVAIVIYDSSVPIGHGRAVYVGARASVVPQDELVHECGQAFARVSDGAKQFQPHELSGEAALRLYRAQADRVEVHVPGRDPLYGVGVDTRREITL
jgi:nitroimidazol reductase NimA-like FMN-containing flavoprotein (pyridoxamine 5'-phosphate oxidase superfamily)